MSLLLAPATFAGDFEDGMQFVLSKDYARAVQSFRKAAEDGNADAQFNLGVMYSKGRGVEQDYARAAHWYRKAAEQDDVPAQSIAIILGIDRFLDMCRTALNVTGDLVIATVVAAWSPDLPPAEPIEA